MREISAENQAALEQRVLFPRDFLWIVPRDRDTGELVEVGFWSDIGDVTAEVINPDTLEIEEREFVGSGTLISIADIPQVADVQIQTIPIRLSQLEEAVTNAVRFYDCRQARVEIFRGLFHPGGRAMVAPAECRFVGFIDKLSILTGAEGEEGSVVLSGVAHTRELTRANPDTRSHESQIVRHPGDNFFVDAGTVGEWEIFWGRNGGSIDSKSSGGGKGGGKPDWHNWGPVQ